ncbi:hypothetical protein FQN53_002859 [Emmonsiellopsis sp. PD_33]|nr:hypothetical protein FQN53_002859 [Emmonsiellopsis sp. PD_33]
MSHPPTHELLQIAGSGDHQFSSPSRMKTIDEPDPAKSSPGILSADTSDASFASDARKPVSKPEASTVYHLGSFQFNPQFAWLFVESFPSSSPAVLQDGAGRQSLLVRTPPGVSKSGYISSSEDQK